MKHISTISRTPVVAESDTQDILQTIVDFVSFLFEMLGAFEVAFSTITSAILELKDSSAQ